MAAPVQPVPSRPNVVIVGPSHPRNNPRLVRNAGALARQGYAVTVVTPALDPAKMEVDSALAASGGWRHRPVELYLSDGRVRTWYRIKRRLAHEVLSRFPIPSLAAGALAYGASRLLATAASFEADFYLAQQQACLPLVAALGTRANRPFGCDIEDVLGECSDEPRALFQSVEAACLPKASLVLTMSESAKDYLAARYGCGSRTLALHNCPSLAERSAVSAPVPRPVGSRPSIYWFGQTLGPHSCAVELITANAFAGSPFFLRFRGQFRDSYIAEMYRAATAAGAPGSFECLPLADPRAMVSEAAANDVLFGSQPSQEPFHQLAIGNKVFTGLLAGCALLLSDTIAHRRLAPSLGEACLLVDHTNPAALQHALRRLAASPDQLHRRRLAAWALGETTFHWEMESHRFCAAVASLLPRAA